MNVLAVLATTLALCAPPEQDPDHSTGGRPFLQRVFSESHLELGAIYTGFDDDLLLEERIGVYGRVSIPAYDRWYGVIEWRHYEGSNDDEVLGEEIQIDSILFGASYRANFWPEVDFVFTGEMGAVFLGSNLLTDDTGFQGAIEAAAHFHLTELLHIKLALGADIINTEFHQAEGDEWAIDYSLLLGIDFGM